MARRNATLKDLELEAWFRDREKERIVWKTKAGDIIPINKMTDSHLHNTIAMIEKANEDWYDYLEALGSIGDTDI